MPPIRTDNFSALLAPNRYKIYVETGQKRPKEFPVWINTIDMPYQGYINQQISGLGPMVEKPEGVQFTYDSPILGNTKTHTALSYGSGFEITFEMWRDELYGVMDLLAAELRRISDYRMELDAYNVVNTAFVTTSYTVFDGVALISASHVGLDGVTRSNTPTVNVQVGLTGLQQGIIHFHNLTNERGIPMVMVPSWVMISPQFVFTIQETLGSAYKPFSTNNEINSITDDGLKYFVSHYLSTNTNWFMFSDKGEHDMNFNIITPPMFDYFDDPRTKNAVFTVYQAEEPSQADEWRGVYGSQG